MRKSAHKKEFYSLNVAKSGIKRVLQHDNAQEESSRKFEQKKSFFTRYTCERKSAKMHRNAHQKKKLMTQYRRKGKSLEFPGKAELVDTIRAQEKSYKKLHKKECASRHIGHPKKQITKKY